MRFRLWCLSTFFVVAGVIAIGLGQPEALAQKTKKKDLVIDVFGEPKGFKAGESVRYAVWATKKGWHVRTTTAKKQHYFTGKIHVDGGTIVEVEPFHLENKVKFHDWWRVNEKRQDIVIDFKTDGGIDGINIQVSKDAKMIHFNLLIDGKHQPNLIFIGRDGIHPDRDPFNAPAHPTKK